MLEQYLGIIDQAYKNRSLYGNIPPKMAMKHSSQTLEGRRHAQNNFN